MRTYFLFLIILVSAFNVMPFKGLKATERVDYSPGTDDSVSIPKNKVNPDLPTPYHLNVVKFNPTPVLLFDEPRNITFSYERLVKKNQSVSLQLGYLIIPQVLNDTLFNTVLLIKDKRNGVNLSLDYRIYPFSRNRRPAPDGMYFGGYLSYINTSSEIEGTLMNATGDDNILFNTRMNMVNLGFELGYQFIFGKRFSIDLLMFGPSLTGYSGKLGITGNLNSEVGNKIDEELMAKLKEHFPALGYLFSDESSTFSTSKIVISSWFRYSVQFGYHF